jgi:hypothetical protein
MPSLSLHVGRKHQTESMVSRSGASKLDCKVAINPWGLKMGLRAWLGVSSMGSKENRKHICPLREAAAATSATPNHIRGLRDEMSYHQIVNRGRRGGAKKTDEQPLKEQPTTQQPSFQVRVWFPLVMCRVCCNLQASMCELVVLREHI